MAQPSLAVNDIFHADLLNVLFVPTLSLGRKENCVSGQISRKAWGVQAESVGILACAEHRRCEQVRQASACRYFQDPNKDSLKRKRFDRGLHGKNGQRIEFSNSLIRPHPFPLRNPWLTVWRQAEACRTFRADALIAGRMPALPGLLRPSETFQTSKTFPCRPLRGLCDF
jgi:hypothetical protein